MDPANQSTVERGSIATITTDYDADENEIAQVEFYVEDELVCTDSQAPYRCDWNVPDAPGVKHPIRARAFGLGGREDTDFVDATVSE